MNKPTVVILAAGKNSRFFPFNNGPHKSTLSLFGEPIILRTLKNLEQHGYKDIVIVISERDHDGKGLSKLLEDFESDLAINLVLQKEAIGMGDAVLAAKEFLKDQFLVIRPTLINAGEISNKFLEKKEDMVLCGLPVEQPWLYGIFEMKDGKAVGLVEKPAKGTEPSDVKIEAVYLLDQNYLQTLKETPSEEYSFELAIDKILKKKAISLVTFEEEFPSLKLPWQLFDFQKALFAQLKSFKHPTADISSTAIIDEEAGAVHIAEGARVGHSARVVGPCYLGPHSLVGDFSFVRQSSLEKKAVVGANSELVRSIMMENSSFHFGYIADSIIGKNVRIGAGIITANKRLDRKIIQTKVKNKMLSTHRRTLGAIVGNGAKLGISSNTMPGVLIGSEAIVLPNQVVSKNLDHKETLG
ncbi:MAG: sugar phosphate nucleotidyltransferase [Patescibacteria group bacterium]